MSTTTAPTQPAGADAPKPWRQPARSGRAQRAYYWLVVPAFVLFFVFHTIPVLQGVFFSFTNFAGYGEWDFVGLRNYANLVYDDRIRSSYLFTFQVAILSTIFINVLGLAIAIGLNAKIRFRTALRGIYFLPKVLAILVIGYVFNFFFRASLPAIGERLGNETLGTNLLADPGLAWIAVVVFAVWQATAFAVILYLAGLQTVPDDVYEAAGIDGANAWQKFRSITFPLIAPFFTINMVLALKDMLMIFDHVVALTNGGPGTATESISLVIYRGGFQGGEFAYQTANAVIYFLVIVLVSFTQLRALQRREVSI